MLLILNILAHLGDFEYVWYLDYLQKTVVMSFCTLELTPPILYSPIVFMPAGQWKGKWKWHKEQRPSIQLTLNTSAMCCHVH